MNYSTYNYRIQPIFLAAKPSYTWIFLPGGPGLGSEYLRNFSTQLELPGSKLLVDFPKDGTNELGELNFNYWKKGLIDLLHTVKNPILVTHSFSGMFALSTPELEPYLSGLVLMNTTTSNTFFAHVSAMQEQYHLPDLGLAAAQYHLNPSSETYRAFWDTYKYYCFTREELMQGAQMLPLLAFNNESYNYAIQHFYQDYCAHWQPKIATMTISGGCDFICPPKIFVADPAFQGPHILNRIISRSGHCPWILQFNEVQHCFNEYLKILSSGSIIN